MSEVLIHKIPKTDFEKLIWERHMNKELCGELSRVRQEKGALQSEVDEVRAEMQMLLRTFKEEGGQVGQLIVKNKKLKEQLKVRDEKLRKATRAKDDIMQGYIRLQKEKRGLLNNRVNENAS